MNSNSIQIDQMRVRAPGLSVEQAQRFGELLQQRLSTEPFATSQSGHISTLNVRVDAKGSRSLETLIEEIVRVAGEKLK